MTGKVSLAHVDIALSTLYFMGTIGGWDAFFGTVPERQTVE